MALSKVTYVDGVTIITAKNLNDIQDELIRQGEQQAEDEASLAGKAEASEMTAALALKADKSDTYTKAEVNEALGLKANTADVNEALALKADKTETYTKAQVDSIVEDAIAEAVKESEYSNFEMKSVSGDFIHITDGAGLIPVKDLKIGIDAVQDLHGYDAPWVGGAGKNLLPMGSLEGIKSRNTNGTWNDNVYTYNGLTITVLLDNGGNVIGFKANGTTTAAVSFRVVSEATYVIPAGEYILTGTNEIISDYDLNLRESGTSSDITQRGTPKAFTLEADTTFSNAYLYVYGGRTLSNIEFYPMVRLASVTDGSFAPYSNICPISGWTGAKVTRTGKNLWDDSIAPTNIEAYSLSGNKGTYNGRNLYLPQGTYKFSFNGTTIAYIYGNVVNTDGSWVSTFQLTTGSSSIQPPTFTLLDGQYAKLFVASGSETELTSGKIQLELGSTATEYEPYDGHVYSVTWEEAGTVYGGTLDVTTGELVVTHKGVDLSTAEATASTAHGGYWTYHFNDIVTIAGGSQKVHGISDSYVAISPNNYNYQFGAVYQGVNSLNVSFVNKDSANKPTGQFVYELAEPVEYDITAVTDIVTLLGENNIFADTGAVEELIYRISRQ